MLVCVLGGPVTQWLVFQPGNFSETNGAVYLPLGEHGIYTSRALGIACYSFLAIFSMWFVMGVVMLLQQRKR